MYSPLKKTCDKNGVELSGIFRSPDNYGLVVNDQSGYSKYMKEKKRIEDIENLKTDMIEVKGMLSEILKAIHGKSNI